MQRIYGGLHVSAPELRSFRHIVDPFSVVVASLVCDLCETFAQSGASFHPSYVYQDVCAAVSHLGRGSFAAEVAAAPGAFIHDAPQLHAMLAALRANGRKLLLLTNSDFTFVDVGMRHMLRAQLPSPADWPALFDVVVVAAQRPSWFTDDAPFRSYNTSTSAPCLLSPSVRLRECCLADCASQTRCGGCRCASCGPARCTAAAASRS